MKPMVAVKGGESRSFPLFSILALGLADRYGSRWSARRRVSGEDDRPGGRPVR